MSKYSTIAPKTKDMMQAHFGKTYSHIKRGATVLDVGCSTGYYARLLIDNKGCTVDGIEIDAADRKEAKKYLREVYDVDLNSADWPRSLTAKKYDVIFLGDVIEHVIDATDVLLRLRALLSTDGVLIISTPNIAHLTVRLELLGGNFEYERTGILDETHLKYFTIKSLTSLVTKAGLQVKEVDYSLNDLHPDTILHHLNTVGLKPTKKFWESMQQPDARAYQWKLVLVKGTITSVAKELTPPSKPMENNYWFAGQVKDLTKKNEELSKSLVEYKDYLSTITEELGSVKSSLGWRIQKKINFFMKRK